MEDTQRRAAPLASLTMATSLSKGSTSAAAAAVRSVPALPSRPGIPAGPLRQPLPAAAAATGATPRPAATASASSRQQHGQQQQQTRGGFRPWGLPLAAGMLAFRLARSAASHVLPALAPGRTRQPAAAADMRVFPSLLPKRIGSGRSGPPGMPGGRKPALLWFRNDLRLHDHEPLAAACAGATSLLPVYIFDPREYGKSPNGFDKTGPYRAKFILEALGDLRDRLRAAGSDLLVRIGKPEEVLPELARSIGAGAVYCHGEVTAEDAKVEGAVSKALDKAGAALKVSWGGTLFHMDDLPFKLASMPPNYSDFRQALRGRGVREPVEAPAQLKGLPAASVCPGELPTLQQLGFDAATLSRCASDKDAAGAHLRGGESEALRRLSEFVSKFTAQQQQKGAAAGAGSSSSKAAQGKLYVQLQQAAGSQAKAAGQPQQLPGAGKEGDTGMQWLLFELLWRDFFRFITKKYTVTGVAQRLGSSPGISEVPAAATAAAPAMAMA
ncbi:hypothetical protein OEZ85_012284 [Tetradesmus obliquus]|uniref:Photolyase/cryptochrome alpha/beta domain-containing protein n=1 Tax=Tetradesmus obliquus TaxID=3088 RepID=A0ABY8TT97_TETOB|nr:hypothetical protein OEZ85_012284 [Tetradesmus obliquus]